MPSTQEIDTIQKERLYDLLMLEKLNKGNKVFGLARQITRAKAPMKKEDIAYVVKLIDELDD